MCSYVVNIPERLLQHGVQSVMVEGGSAILTACLHESARTHLVDSVVVTIAPTFVSLFVFVAHFHLHTDTFTRWLAVIMNLSVYLTV